MPANAGIQWTIDSTGFPLAQERRNVLFNHYAEAPQGDRYAERSEASAFKLM